MPPPRLRADGSGQIERRRRPRGTWSQIMHGALPMETLEVHALRLLRRALVVLALVAVIAAPIAGFLWWRSIQVPELVPRHRAEALCFALARPPAFTPPMAIETGAAIVRGRFSEQTPAPIAIRETMRLREDMVLREFHRQVGDFDVTVMWLRLPDNGGARHWLVIGWMEGSDLATCSFSFSGDATELTGIETAWGEHLLRRILQPDYFQAGVTPNVRWRSPNRQPLPRFGPASAR